MSILNSTNKVVVVGLGKSGLSAHRLLKELLGFNRDRVKTFDESLNSAADFSKADEISEYDPDFVVLSPGYPRSKPWVANFLKKKGEAALISELDLANIALQTLGEAQERCIGITGSAGKSTSSALLARALEAAGHRVFLGGNYGVPFCDYAYEVLSGSRPRAEFVVLELSSYQLESLKMGVEIGVITSLSRNHLDRYPSLEAYYETKAKLCDLSSDCVILNSASSDLVSWFADPHHKKASPLIWTIHRAWSGQKLLGKHNEQNLDVVATILDHLHMPEAAYESLLTFEGLAHRLENCGFWNGMLFVNDSKATTIESVLVAVEALKITCGGKMHLLIGGKDKDLPWQNLSVLAQMPFVQPWFFGEVAEKAQKLSGLHGEHIEQLEDFFKSHRQILKSGDVVLLSPGGSSLDRYKSFEARGEEFKSLVKRYILSS